jgi:hypothetical protein
MSSEEKFLALVFEHRETVKAAVELLNYKSEKNEGFQLHRAGYLDSSEGSTYEFHGFGCLIKTKGFTIDFDFGEGGRCDGINAGFLLYFINKNININLKYSQFGDCESISYMLKQLEDDGIFVRDLSKYLVNHSGFYGDSLYYLVSNINALDTPIWRP